MIRPLYDVDKDTVENCLGLIERGMARLGITEEMLRRPQRALLGAAPRANKPARRLTPEMISDMISLTREHVPQAAIAARLGCSQSLVSKALMRIGIHGRPQRAHHGHGQHKLSP